ncbi:MAG: hypothetical protein RLZZ24_501 [Pseudomonadota bacterium]
MSHEHASINGALLRLRREARGWLQADVATRACMSIKQIRQLEDGGLSAFYSEAVKVTAAKKVGGLLGLTHDEVFSHGQPELPRTTHSISPDADLAELLASTHEQSQDDIHHEEAVAHGEALAHDPSAHGSSTLDLTASANAAEATNGDAADHGHAAAASEQVEPVSPAHEATAPAAAMATAMPSGEASAKPKTSIGLILVLFVGAIVLAAIFRPEQEAAPTEPPPPLQPALQSEPAPDGAKDPAAPADANNPAANTSANPASPAAPSGAQGNGAPAASAVAQPAAPAPSAASTAASNAAPVAAPANAPAAPASPAGAPAKSN